MNPTRSDANTNTGAVPPAQHITPNNADQNPQSLLYPVTRVYEPGKERSAVHVITAAENVAQPALADASAESGRPPDAVKPRIVKWNLKKKECASFGFLKLDFDVTAADGRYGEIIIWLREPPNGAGFLAWATLHKADGPYGESYSLSQLDLPEAFRKLILGMAVRKRFGLLRECVCTRVFKNLLDGYRRLFACRRSFDDALSHITALQSAMSAIKRLEKGRHDRIADNLQLSACELLIFLSWSLDAALKDLQCVARHLARSEKNFGVRCAVKALGAGARVYRKSACAVATELARFRESLGYPSAMQTWASLPSRHWLEVIDGVIRGPGKSSKPRGSVEHGAGEAVN
jgi:hypothetical protein